jgi:hypothetical protein
MDPAEDQERRSKRREASAAGVFIAAIILMLLGIGVFIALTGWPTFSATVSPTAPVP